MQSATSGVLRRHRSRLVVVAVGVVLIAAAVWAIRSPYWSHGCGGMFSGMTRTATDECVGVVADGALLDKDLQDLYALIDTENRAVADGAEPFVRVVLLSPLSLAKRKASAMSMAQIAHSIQGAYAAQWRVNHERDFGDPTAAKIQLILANHGSRQEYSERLVDDILGVHEPAHPLVAVVGLGSSFVGTKQTAQALAARGIPMMSAVASADDLDARHVPGLRSVSPSSTSYAKALRALLDTGTLKLRSGILVADENQDLYVQSLRAAFTVEMPGYSPFPPRTFAGGTIDSAATPQVFRPVVSSLCTAAASREHPLDMVFYAGRVADFRAFAESLENRMCRDQPLTVLVGATGFQAAQQYEGLLERGKVTVIYASSSDATAWSTDAPGTPAGFARFADRFRGNGFPLDALADGYAIAYHDALASVAAAIRLAAQARRIPTPADVNSQLDNLSLGDSVTGASGTLTFTADTDGRATGRVVPYRQIGRTTPVQLPAGLPPYRVGT